ncbi:MAG: response regulator transcription factor [Chloroflexota bacterium]
MDAIKILIIDDHSVVRQGIRSLLSNYVEFKVIGEAENGRSGLAQFQTLKPDVTLLDIRMPDLDGTELIHQIRGIDVSARVVMLTSFDDDEYIDASLQAGAMGYVLKSGSDENLVNAIHAAMRGERFLSPKVTDRVVERLMNAKGFSQQTAVSSVELDPDDQEILHLLVQGYSNAEIGETLFMSNTSVKRKLSKIFEKLNVQTRTQAAAEAVRQGFA